MEKYFKKYKDGIIGDEYLPQINQYGKKILYADWAGSGRLEKNIEDEIIKKYAPFYSNSHSEESYIGRHIQNEYLKAKDVIKRHFNGNNEYAVIASGYGMTAAINKFQDIVLNGHYNNIVVFITPYEHNSNYISWIKKGIRVYILDFDEYGQVDEEDFEKNLINNKDKRIIGSFTACSNVTGIKINIDILINQIKKYNGIVCIDYTTIAPYEKLDLIIKGIDAVVFSSHKLIGGVGGPGILIVKKSIYDLNNPTVAGGGVVNWVSNTGKISYINDIEMREEAGTPPIIQIIRTSLAIKLKETMGVINIEKREYEINNIMFAKLTDIKNLILYEQSMRDRICIYSFNIIGVAYKKVIRELDSEYGIQCRGGCSCAAIYGHRLLNINEKQSIEILENISMKSDIGWVRISLSPLMNNKEIDYICNAIREIADRYYYNSMDTLEDVYD